MNSNQYLLKLVLMFGFLIMIGCHSDNRSFPMVRIKEAYLTPNNQDDNIDSPAFYQQNDTTALVIATAKSTHLLVVYNAANGKIVRRFGKQGSNLGEFNRPNGISVVDSLLFVVERDNRRVQLIQLPDFKPLMTFGEGELRYPYGIFVEKKDRNYRIYITDDYRTAGGDVPEPAKLNERVKVYTLTTDSTAYKAKLKFMFGDTIGEGVLHVVESIYGDPQNNVLMIADEEAQKIKVYDFQGKFSGIVIGENMFMGDPEGISLAIYGDKGYWICTDQTFDKNLFILFDRHNFKVVSSFYGDKTLNTDGVWLTQNHFANFTRGAFFAVDNDGGFGAFDVSTVLKKTKISYE